MEILTLQRGILAHIQERFQIDGSQGVSLQLTDHDLAIIQIKILELGLPTFKPNDVLIPLGIMKLQDLCELFFNRILEAAGISQKAKRIKDLDISVDIAKKPKTIKDRCRELLDDTNLSVLEAVDDLLTIEELSLRDILYVLLYLLRRKYSVLERLMHCLEKGLLRRRLWILPPTESSVGEKQLHIDLKRKRESL